MVVPPELVGGHIGPTTSHTTARTHDLSFRAITALFGHFGMEWDVREVQGAERDELKRFIGIYKEHRALIHGGRMVRADVPDDSLMLHGVVAGGKLRRGHRDGSPVRPGEHADIVRRAARTDHRPGPRRRPQLPPGGRVPGTRATPTTPTPSRRSRHRPGWPSGAEASGRFLAEVGLPMPNLNPEHALLLQVTALYRPSAALPGEVGRLNLAGGGSLPPPATSLFRRAWRNQSPPQRWTGSTTR